MKKVKEKTPVKVKRVIMDQDDDTPKRYPTASVVNLRDSYLDREYMQLEAQQFNPDYEKYVNSPPNNMQVNNFLSNNYGYNNAA